jgi:hypothetical protein
VLVRRRLWFVDDLLLLARIEGAHGTSLVATVCDLMRWCHEVRR